MYKSRTMTAYFNAVRKAERRIAMSKPKYWMGTVKEKDDFGAPISKIMIDGRTRMGPWACMAPASWTKHGVGVFGTGYGQKYVKQEDGRWLKVEG